LAEFFVKWNIFHTKVVEKIKTHFMFNDFFPPENRAVYEVMWKNNIQPDRPQMAIEYGACALHVG